VLLWRTDEEGRVTRADPWGSGELEDEVRLPESAGGVLHPDDRASVAQAWEDAVAAQEPVETEYRLRMADGSYRWMLDRGRPAWATDGSFTGHVGATVDIHERTEADRRAPLEPAELAALLPAEEARSSAADLAEAVRRVAEERAGGPLRDDVAIVALMLDPG
jgi:PAS domain S-box-containing protein